MTIQGMRHTANFVANQRPENWRETYLILYPNGDAPLTALSSLMKSEPTDDAVFHWWEKSMQTRRVALGANLDTGTGNQNITVASGALQFKEGDILRVEQTGETLFVYTNPTVDTTLPVARSFGSVASTAVDYDGAGINPNLLLIGSAYEEGSSAPSGRAFDPVEKFNYTQIFRNTFEHTRTAIKTRLRTQDDVKEAKRETLELHARDLEFAFLFGERATTTKNGKPMRTTAGIRSQLAASNILAPSSGELDLDTWELYMESFFKFGSSEKLAFCGNRAMTTIQQAVRKNSAYTIYANEKLAGIKVNRLVGPHGELIIKRHPMFSQVVGGVNTAVAYAGLDASMLVVDQAKLKYRFFSGDDMRYEPELQDNGVDGTKSGFITEAGWEVHNPETHFWIDNLSSGVADS